MSVSNPAEFRNAILWRAGAGLVPKRGAILIIADDSDLAEAMRTALEGAGFVVQIASSVREGLRVGSLHGASTIIVERGADGSDSLKVVEALRAADDRTPVMVVGVSESVEERIAYIRSGADDYLARPFDLREMTARVEALLRRCEDRKTVLHVGAIEIDLVGRAVRCMGRSVDLLPREFTLLEYFARHPKQILSRRQLLEDIWRSKTHVNTNVVDVQVGTLRRKLDPTGERRFIVSIRGAGFRLEPDGLD
jgi:two-component system OmpR family response regulator